VLPPEGRGPERTRSVLRRFSHFTKLHANVRRGPSQTRNNMVLGRWLVGTLIANSWRTERCQ